MPTHSRNKYSVSIPDRVVVAIRPARAGVRHRTANTAKSSYREQRAGARSHDRIGVPGWVPITEALAVVRAGVVPVENYLPCLGTLVHLGS